MGTLHLTVNMLAFRNYILLRKEKWTHFIRKEIFFSQEHHALFGQPASSVSILINYLMSWLKYRCNCLGYFPTDRRCQVQLVEEAQDGVSSHNTWSSKTSYGGINPYTLTTRIGPKGLTHYKMIRGLIDLFGVPCKKGKRGKSSKILISWNRN